MPQMAPQQFYYTAALRPISMQQIHKYSIKSVSILRIAKPDPRVYNIDNNKGTANKSLVQETGRRAWDIAHRVGKELIPMAQCEEPVLQGQVGIC